MQNAIQRSIVMPAVPPAVRERSADQARDLYHIFHDEESGVIRATVQGFWSVEEADRYFDNLRLFIESGHQRAGKVRVLIDRRGSGVQSPEVARRMQVANGRYFRPADRLAVVVDSSLLKLQLRRLFTHEGSKAFLSFDAAVTWLQAFR